MATFLLSRAHEAPAELDDWIDLLRQIADRLDAMPLNRVGESEDPNGSPDYATLLAAATTQAGSRLVAA